jgi:hypothetical protein
MKLLITYLSVTYSYILPLTLRSNYSLHNAIFSLCPSLNVPRLMLLMHSNSHSTQKCVTFPIVAIPVSRLGRKLTLRKRKLTISPTTTSLLVTLLVNTLSLQVNTFKRSELEQEVGFFEAEAIHYATLGYYMFVIQNFRRVQ